MINCNYVKVKSSSSDGHYIRFGRERTFDCTLSLWYITGTMNNRDFRKMIKTMIWALDDPAAVLEACRILEEAFTITIKLSKSAPKNMKYLQEVIAKYELQ